MVYTHPTMALSHILGWVAEGKLVVKVQGDITGGQFSLPPLLDPYEPTSFLWKRFLSEFSSDIRFSGFFNPNTVYMELTIPERYLHSEGRLIGNLNRISTISRHTTPVELPRHWRAILLHLKYQYYPELDDREEESGWYFGAPHNLLAFDGTRKAMDPYDRRRKEQRQRDARERREHNRKVLRSLGITPGAREED